MFCTDIADDLKNREQRTGNRKGREAMLDGKDIYTGLDIRKSKESVSHREAPSGAGSCCRRLQGEGQLYSNEDVERAYREMDGLANGSHTGNGRAAAHNTYSKSTAEDVRKGNRRMSIDYSDRDGYFDENDLPAEDGAYGSGKVPEKPKRRRHPVRKALRIILVVFAAMLAVYSAAALHYIGKVSSVPDGERLEADAGLLDSVFVRNILLVGTDSRSADDGGRADTVMLLSVNFRSRRITLASFMRDSYVDVPGHGMSKLNAAFRWGGPELLMDTLQKNFRIRIDDYVFVDFQSFADIVDAVGGIELTVTDEEAKGMQAPMSEVNRLTGKPKGTDYLYKGGTYNMNGNQALGYARLRYVGNADFQRTERQREVVKSILEKAKTLGISELDKFISVCAESVTTNLTKGEMYRLALELPVIAFFEMEGIRIPADGLYSGATSPEGQSVLKIDFDGNIGLIEEKLYGG